MSDIINKIIGVILAFMILVFGPLCVVTLTQDLSMQRGVMNAMEILIDKTTSTGVIEDKQLEQFYLDVSSFGYAIDSEIKRYVPVYNPDENGNMHISYMPSNNNRVYSSGDIIQVTCKAIDWSGPQKMLRAMLRLSQSKFDVTMANRIR